MELPAHRFVPVPHPDPTTEGLTAYDVVVDGRTVGQVWQQRTVSYGKVDRRSTGYHTAHHIDWARTGSDELETTRRGAARSLVRAVEADGRQAT